MAKVVARHIVLGTIYKALGWNVWQVDQNFMGRTYSHQFLFTDGGECMGYWNRLSHIPTRLSDSVGMPYKVEYSEKLETGLQIPLQHSIYTDPILAMGLRVSDAYMGISPRPCESGEPTFFVGHPTTQDMMYRWKVTVWDKIPETICQMVYQYIKVEGQGQSISYCYKTWHYKDEVLGSYDVLELHNQVRACVLGLDKGNE